MLRSAIVASDDGRIEIEIPKGALDDEIELSIDDSVGMQDLEPTDLLPVTTWTHPTGACGRRFCR